MDEIFDGVTRVEYTITAGGIKVPYSNFDRPESYYDGVRAHAHTADQYAGMCRFKDKTIALYDRRWQSAKAVIDLIAKELSIDSENCDICLYGLSQNGGEFSSPLVDKMLAWFDKSGDKVKMKKRIAELEVQLETLRAAIGGRLT